MSVDMLGTLVRKLVNVPAEAHGTLIDLSEKLAGPNRAEWLAASKQFLRKEPVWALGFRIVEAYTVRLGGPETTDQIVQDLKKKGLWVNDYVTQENFPLKPHDHEDVEIEILDPRCSFSEEGGLKLLAEAGLERPTYEQALRFAEQCGKTTKGKKLFIIFLHKPWQDPDGPRRVLYVNRHPADRGLDLGCAGDGWSGHCVLAGVRPRSPR